MRAGSRTPSVDDIAAAADVSRRTVYMYFPTLGQLLLDAAVGALVGADVDTALDAAGGGSSARERVGALAGVMLDQAATTLPLGRQIIRLTVDAPLSDEPAGRRGYRRIGWLERALAPLRASLSEDRFERLVSALAIIVGWEAMTVLRDIRGLDPDAEREVMTWAARALIDQILAEADGDRVEPVPAPK